MGVIETMARIAAFVLSPAYIYAAWLGGYVILGYLYKVYVKKYPIKRLEDGYIIKEKRRSILYRLFIEFPKRMLQDLLDSDPYDFKEFGMHLFVGSQGSGKTVSMVEWLQATKRAYPKCKIITNFNYKYQDDEIKDWTSLLNINNENLGVIKCIDEIQTWFSSKESGQMPYELLGEICQQRKQRSCIVGTAQVFSRVSKEIREQTLYVYCPKTFFGCLTVVRRTTPEHWDNEKQTFKRYNKMYFFVHTEEIRNAFDTFKKIERYKDQGFHDRQSQSGIDLIIKNTK